MTPFDHLAPPRIVCLCGSTRFMQFFQDASLAETLAGRIVLSVGCDTKSDHDLAVAGVNLDKDMLDWLHRRKIDLADEVLILNVGGYVGESTRREALYAYQQKKRVRWLQPLEAPCFLMQGDRPTFTADIVVVWRGALLLIKRRYWPFDDMWALPGGKADPGETLMQTAARELQEETGLDGLALIEVATFDALGRDPRGCFISTAFLALVPDHVDLAPKAADDAKEAQWFPLSALPTLPLAFDHTQIVRCTLAQPFARLLQSGVQL